MRGLNRHAMIYWVSALSLTGLLISIWQSLSYLQLQIGTASTHAFCDLNQTFDCTAVEMSPYAEFLPGFPLSGMAIAGYSFIFLLSIGQWRSTQKIELKFPLMGLSAISFLFSVIYFSLMLKIGKLCLLCLIIDSINVFLVILTFRLPGDFKVGNIKLRRVSGVGMVSILFSVFMLKGIELSETASAAEMKDKRDGISCSPLPDESKNEEDAKLIDRLLKGHD